MVVQTNGFKIKTNNLLTDAHIQVLTVGVAENLEYGNLMVSSGGYRKNQFAKPMELNNDKSI